MAERTRVLFPHIAAETLRPRPARVGASRSTLACLVCRAKGLEESKGPGTHIPPGVDFLARAHMTHLAKSETTCTGHWKRSVCLD